MTSHDFTLLAGHIYIAASLVIFGLDGNRRIGKISSALGIFIVVIGLVAKTVAA